MARVGADPGEEDSGGDGLAASALVAVADVSALLPPARRPICVGGNEDTSCVGISGPSQVDRLCAYFTSCWSCCCWRCDRPCDEVITSITRVGETLANVCCMTVLWVALLLPLALAVTCDGEALSPLFALEREAVEDTRSLSETSPLSSIID